MKYILLFILIQVVSAVLFVVGLPVCAALAYGRFWTYSINMDAYHWPRWAWLFDNKEDGVCPWWYMHVHPTWSTSRLVFTWTALRNSVNNLRFVRGVSKVGRPLWRKTWGAKPGGWYISAGWNNSGYPVLSGGRNVNTW